MPEKPTREEGLEALMNNDVPIVFPASVLCCQCKLLDHYPCVPFFCPKCGHRNCSDLSVVCKDCTVVMQLTRKS